MHCTEIKQYLYEYLTNRLDEQARKEVESHLQTCPACRQELEELKVDLKLLDHAKPPEVSADFKDRVMKNIEQQKVIPFRRRQTYKYVLQGTVAAVVLLAVAVTFIMKSQQQEPVVRGVSKESAVTEACSKAVDFYNKGTTTRDLQAKQQLFTSALACNCDDRKILARIRNNLADCFEKQGKQEEAISLYKAAIEDDAGLVYPYISLGEHYKMQGEEARAIFYYEKALELLKNQNEAKTEIQKIEEELAHMKQGNPP